MWILVGPMIGEICREMISTKECSCNRATPSLNPDYYPHVSIIRIGNGSEASKRYCGVIKK